MSKIRYNKSKTYLLPLLSELVKFDKRFFSNLINTYIEDDLNQYKDCLIIEHDFSFKHPEFTAYENKFIENELFVDLFDLNNKVIYIFKFPEVYLHEYTMFKQGKYSKFGIDAKELILKFFTNVYFGNPEAANFLLKLNQILFKDNKLKKEIEENLNVVLSDDSELADRIDIVDETFKLSKIKTDRNDINIMPDQAF